jgi:hypothetical protein
MLNQHSILLVLVFYLLWIKHEGSMISHNALSTGLID